jgi:Ca2+-binding RTX toxin-like protein
MEWVVMICLFGYAGNDILNGGVGLDGMYGGLGDDTYIFKAGDSPMATPEYIYEFANEGIDTIKLTGGILPANVQMWVDGSSFHIRYSANDEIVIQNGYDGTLAAGKYIEKISFENGTIWDLRSGFNMTDTNDSHTMNATNQTDIIDGKGGDDNLYAFDGNDTLIGGTGQDYLAGGLGDDIYIFKAGDSPIARPDTVYEGLNEGIDTIKLTGGILPSDVRMWSDRYNLYIRYSSIDQITVLGNQGYSSANGTANYVEKISFDNGVVWDIRNGLILTDTDDGHSIVGSNVADIIDGRLGNDGIQGFDGNDIISGGVGDDYLYGGNGSDRIDGGSGNDYLSGDADMDTVTYASALSAVTVNLGFASAQNTIGAGTDTLYSFENLTGSAYNDTLTGDANANIIQGGAGNDIMNGMAGSDTASYADSTAAVTVNLGLTTAQNTIGAGTDTLTGFENLTGSAYNDTLTGDANANILQGSAGNDILNGMAGSDTASYADSTAAVTVNLGLATAQNTVGAGTDTLTGFENLTGSAYNDTLIGDANANILQGSAGNDILNGMAGSDTASYADSTAAVTVNLGLATAQNTVGAGVTCSRSLVQI